MVEEQEDNQATSDWRAIDAQQRAAEAEKKAAAADALAAAFARHAQGTQEPSDDASKTGFADLDGTVGLGVDIVEIDHMERILQNSPRFPERTYSEEERAYCDKMARPAVHYATRFAAKEAVLKALGTGFIDGIAPTDVEVQRTSTGRPMAVLSGKAAEVAEKMGVKEIPISLSYTHNEAVACAMAITQNSVKAAEKRVDPMDELTRQFKDARALLDDLPVTEGAHKKPAMPEEAAQETSEEPREESTHEPGVDAKMDEGPTKED